MINYCTHLADIMTIATRDTLYFYETQLIDNITVLLSDSETDLLLEGATDPPPSETLQTRCTEASHSCRVFIRIALGKEDAT